MGIYTGTILSGLALVVFTYILICFMLKHGHQPVTEMTISTFFTVAMMHLLVFILAACFGYSLAGVM